MRPRIANFASVNPKLKHAHQNSFAITLNKVSILNKWGYSFFPLENGLLMGKKGKYKEAWGMKPWVCLIENEESTLEKNLKNRRRFLLLKRSMDIQSI
jgi:hypothetical protein